MKNSQLFLRQAQDLFEPEPQSRRPEQRRGTSLNSQFQRGFSILEVILAMAFFAIFATSAVVALLSGIEANRLGREETVAVQFASEGEEAVKSIKNQAFSNLLTPNPTPRGVQRSAGNVWQFKAAGTSDILVSGKNYTRQLKVENVNRDTNGNIVPAPTGSVDQSSKKVTSTVSWNAGPGRNRIVSLVTYLIDWRKAMEVPAGIIVYSDSVNNPTYPKFRMYNNGQNSFGLQTDSVAGALGRTLEMRTSPSKKEAIAGYVDATGTLRVICYDGAAWSNDWSTTVGGTGTTRRFDIAYETNSGDAIVLYSRNVAGSNELGYRTKLGSTGCGGASWSGEVNLNPARTSGIVHWVKFAWDRRSSSNLLAAIWADASSDLSTMIWSGSAWGNEPSAATETSLEVVSTAQDVDDFDVEYESTSGDVLLVWANSAGGNGTNGVRYRTCNGGTASCPWSSVATPPMFSDDAHNLDISANPSNNEIIFASIGDAGDDLQVGRWSGSSWSNVANKDTSAQTSVAGGHLVTTGWLTSGSTTRGIVVYHDSGTTNLRYLAMTPGSTPSWSGTLSFTPTPAFGNPQRWLDIQMDPINRDRLLFSVSDINSKLFAKRLVMSAGPTFTWTNSDGGASLIGNTLSQAIASPFSFSYWRQP